VSQPQPTAPIPPTLGKNKVVLCGYYGFGNGGDEALLATLLQMLPRHVTPLVLSSNPNFTTALHGVAACNRSDLRAVWQALQGAKGFIWGGGSLIQDATSALSPVYYCALMLLAQWLGVRTIAWGQGVGPLHRASSRWLARQVFRGCRAVSVRDPSSAALLTGWGLQPLQAPDPVWALVAEPMPGLAELPQPRLAVNLRNHPELTPDRLEGFAQALVDLQAATQCFVVLIPFQANQDLEIAELLHQRLPETSTVIQTTNPRQLKGLFQSVQMVIGMRLHALIMAAAEGCRCFGISYDPKVSQLMQLLELPGWHLEQMPETATEMLQQWQHHWHTDQPVALEKRQAIIQQTQQHQELLHQVFADL
jgi:polysaccharide pyruvyl transferase CsaB